MTTLANRSDAASLGRRMLNKVPEVTLYFWVIKIMCTTVGETAADYLNDNLGLGLTNTPHLRRGRPARGFAGRAVPASPVRAGRLLVGRGRDQRLRDAHHRQHDRQVQRPAH